MAALNDSKHGGFTFETCITSQMSPAYERHLLYFERNFDTCSYFSLVKDNWKFVYVFIGAYMLAIIAGQHFMKHRQPFKLRGALLLWNASLAGFCIFCAWRTTTAILYQISLVGFYETICSYDVSKQFLQSLSVYVYLFGFSKILELGDTAFIVLRKTPLIILHWFHHATVCFFVWSCAAYPSPLNMFFMLMNFNVHSILYSYYTLKMLRVPVPKPISVAITSLQIFEMLGGVAFTLYVNRMKATPGIGCGAYDEAINIALSIYFAYFVLFSNFFIKVYIFDKPKRKMVREKRE